MIRKITNQLMEWKNAKEGRLPLIIYASRQMGKTYVMQELGFRYQKRIHCVKEVL